MPVFRRLLHPAVVAVTSTCLLFGSIATGIAAEAPAPDRIERGHRLISEARARAAASSAEAARRHERACGGHEAAVGYDLALEHGRVVRAPLLDAIDGFAREGNTTGGLGGDLHIVTTTADYRPGREPPVPGSLRAALEKIHAAHRPGWIVFDPRTATGTIELKGGTLRLPDDVTLDATCGGVTLVAQPEVTLLTVRDRVNVVVAGLAMRKSHYSGENKGRDDGKDFRDCVTVSGSVDRLAFLHNDFERCGDGEIDITSGVGKRMPQAGGRITIAFNRFGKHDKAMLLGTDGCVDGAKTLAEGCPDLSAGATALLEPRYRVTLMGNLFEWTGQRNPRVFGRVYAHLVNNVFAFEPFDRENGTSGATYGTHVSNGAAVWAEANVFVGVPTAGHTPLALTTTTTPMGIRGAGDLEGAIRAEGNLRGGDEIIAENRPDLVARLTGTGSVTASGAIPRVDVTAQGLEKAIACIAERAGIHGAASWNHRLCGVR